MKTPEEALPSPFSASATSYSRLFTRFYDYTGFSGSVIRQVHDFRDEKA